MSSFFYFFFWRGGLAIITSSSNGWHLETLTFWWLTGSSFPCRFGHGRAKEAPTVGPCRTLPESFQGKGRGANTRALLCCGLWADWPLVAFLALRLFCSRRHYLPWETNKWPYIILLFLRNCGMMTRYKSCTRAVDSIYYSSPLPTVFGIGWSITSRIAFFLIFFYFFANCEGARASFVERRKKGNGTVGFHMVDRSDPPSPLGRNPNLTS